MSKTIVLLQCTSRKQKAGCALPAKELYSGPYFTIPFQYAAGIKYDKIFILSAKHYVVELNDMLDYYNLSLNEMKSTERNAWAKETIRQLKEKGCDLDKDQFIFLTGSSYYKNLLPYIVHHSEPLKGVGIYKIRAWGKTHCKK